MEALDLTAQPPRSPFVKIGGLLLLARTIDKLRAELPGGKLGDYHFAVMSEALCEELGVAHDDLLDVVRDAKDDDEVVTWMHGNTDQSRYAAMNTAFLERSINDSNRERLLIKYPVLADHPHVTSIFEMLDLDDAAQFAKKV